MVHTILGRPIEDITLDELRARWRQALKKGEQVHHITANPEMLVDAFFNPAFAAIFSTAQVVCDGIGIQKMARYVYRKPFVHPRITGSGDLLTSLLLFAETHQLTVGLLGGEASVAKKTQKIWQSQYPLAKFVLFQTPSSLTRLQANMWVGDEQLLPAIRAETPDILLVALGHPKQEFWIKDHLTHLPKTHLFVGVGGSFDFVAGRVRRAPLAMRRIGLEWLWRLFQQPWRILRICKAIFAFPVLCLWDKLAGKKND